MEELIPTLQEEGEERIDTIAEQTIIAGVQTINGKAGDLNLKTINNTDLLTTGNLDLATSAQLQAEIEARQLADTNLQNTKQDNLTAGANIQITNNVISATDTTYTAGNGLSLTGTQFAIDTTVTATQTDISNLQNNKQDKLSSAQLDAVNSGITSAGVSQITTNKNNITDINDKIPAQASDENQLADKNFVNSSIATETANYISNDGEPFTSVEQLEAYSGTVTDNDYAFVTGTDSAGNTYYDRYKATVSGGVVTWAKEYRLNNSSFTSDQWTAINSGATTALIEQITTNQNDIADLQTSDAGKLPNTTTFWGQTAQNGAVEGTLTLTESGQNATISTSGHNTSVAGIKVGNSSNYVEAGVTAITLSSNTGDIKLKPKSGSSVDVMSSKITNLATPTADTDASTKKYVDDGLATKQNTLTAGTNVQITGTTISATDTTYSAGTGLTLTGTTFSVDEPAPSGFFTGNAVTESEGTAITLPNALGTSLKSVELEGDTNQTTYTGKNLWGGKEKSFASPMGFTTVYNIDGTLSIMGTASTRTWSVGTANAFSEGLMLELPAGTYTFTVWGGKETQLVSAALDGTGETANATVNSGVGSATFTTSATRLFYPRIRVEAGATGYTVGFMIVAGSTAGDYEPYTGSTPTQLQPSPNPDYPQEVNVVTGRQTVKVVGKNLCSSAFVKDSSNIQFNCDIASISGNRIALSAILDVATSSNSVYAHVDGVNTGVRLGSFTGSANEVGGSIIYDLSQIASYLENGKELQLILYKSGAGFTSVSDAMIVNGDTLQDYEPYVGQSYEINLGKNLWDEETPYKTDYAINSSGVEEANSNFDIYGNIQVPASTTYTLSAKGGPSDTILRMHAYSLAGVWQEQIFYTTLTANTTITYTFTTPNYPCILRWNCYKNATNRQLELGTQSTTYSAYFAPIELCKIGTYQDYIYKANGNWYKHSEVRKVALTGDVIERWQKASATGKDIYYTDTISDYSRTGNTPVSDYFTGMTNVAGASAVAFTNNHIAFGSASLGTQNRFYVRYDGIWATTSDFETWLSTNTPTVYYALATATDTQITNADLITQLEALASAQLATGINYINSSGVSPNLDAILTVESFNNNWNGLSQALLGA